ncbi:MAG: FAD-dependent oxidoreductase [Deltaproteobacteria bacterium]|nr:FAD-dependent oxidoreductase [Deltaproteobacteria bacterium]
MERDPVCNMEVKEDSALTVEREGKTYFFCSEGCRKKFLRGSGNTHDKKVYDLLILGGGPAGLTAAVYAATLRMEAFLITKDLGGQAVDSTQIENYMGFDFIAGTDLVKKFEDQLLHSHYIDHRIGEVRKVVPDGEVFRVTVDEGETFRARALILATGMRRRRLDVPGEEALQRQGVFYGNIQDASFVEGADVAIVGGGNSALQIVETLHSVVGTIHLICNSTLKADPIVIERVEAFPDLVKHEGYEVLEITGENRVEGISIRNRSGGEVEHLAVGGVFISIGLYPDSSIFEGLVDRNKRGEIRIAPDCSTSRPGIFAAGDLTDAYGKRIVIASGEGAKAALAAREYLLKLSSGPAAS